MFVLVSTVKMKQLLCLCFKDIHDYFWHTLCGVPLHASVCMQAVSSL